MADYSGIVYLGNPRAGNALKWVSPGVVMDAGPTDINALVGAVTGFNVQVPDNTRYYAIKNGITFLAGGIKLPANPVDQIPVTISAMNTIATATITPQTGWTIDGQASLVAVTFKFAKFLPIVADQCWYRCG